MAAVEDIDDEELVHHISKFPVLYDPKNESYKLHTKKEMIWMDIAKKLNTTAVACKKRWKNIRDNYYKTLKKNKMTTGSAASGNRKRNPILDQLGFLQNVEHERSVLTNTRPQLTQDTEGTALTESEDQCDDAASNKSMETNDTQNLTPDRAATAFTNKNSPNNYLEVPPRKRKKNLSSQILSAMQKNNVEREVLMSQLTAVPPTSPEDEIDILFKSLAMTVKNFPPLLRAQTKSRIFQVISDAELQLLLPETPSSRVSTYSHESKSLSLQSPTDTEMAGKYAHLQGPSTSTYLENFQPYDESYE